MAYETRSALEIARTYHEAWKCRDFDAAERQLTEDVAIEVPINSYNSRAAFMDAARMTREMASKVTSIAEFGSEHDAVLIYDMELPIGPLRIAEYFDLSESGTINRIVHVHDTAALRAARSG